MKLSNSPLSFAGRGLLAFTLSAVALWPRALISQQAEYDPEWFDCLELRRDGRSLVYWERFVMNFSCDKASCVNREQKTDEDGKVSEYFRHIFFPRDGKRFILTTSVWNESREIPVNLTSRTRFMVGCFTMTPDEVLWTQDLGEARHEGDEVHATNEKQDYRADYFYAPTRLLGDWSDATAIEFEKKSSGGTYISAYYQDIYGDVVLKNGAMRATFEIPKHHTGEWRQFRVPFDDPGWALQGGASSIVDVLENVTVFQIRAEYASGKDTSAIRNVVVE